MGQFGLDNLLIYMIYYNRVISPVASAAGHKGCSYRAAFVYMGIVQAIIYVDGLNLYYNLVKRTPYKWLNLDALCNELVPQYNIVGCHQVFYCYC